MAGTGGTTSTGATGTQFALRVDAVSKRFRQGQRELLALDNVSFDIEVGRFLVIVGPSGCGKTTLLRILAGLERQDEGQIWIRPNADGHPAAAMVFQEQSVFPWMTVRDNVAYGLALRGVGRRERFREAERWIRSVGLEGFERAYPHQLSGGMKQRVSIARAFAVDPDVLLMDEPFSALDEQTRTILQQEVSSLSEQQHKTVIFVTHSIDEAITLGDEVLVMTHRPGRVKRLISIPFARPRDVVGVRANPRYGELYEEIWQLIAEEVQQGPREE
ncbi:ABC transporter ATP-binding protein [Sphaerobacter sp.]|uniref:ABC transporter ATP-binding protein n=1 Tax=Sphaerobacter sp. TaxID=2099654 RepID=UPI001D62724C|nr:ABC transporter ATP-binding protein [Sphaerobacter sp.]MBX5444445.1 ABC transporter ATP-binding protein [Sphaerobacter sp.]